MIASRNTAKRAAAVISIVAILAMLITGTLAWYATTSALNVFSGRRLPPAVLHDDFDPDTGQKEVYVENTGSSESYAYVRIKLNEFMDLTSERPPAGKEGVAWETHLPTGDGQGEYLFDDCGLENANDEKFHDYFRWVMGGDDGDGAKIENDTKWYMPAGALTGTKNKGAYVQDTDPYTPADAALGARQTLKSNFVHMAEYLDDAFDKEGYEGWIYDEDGWAYWSQPLAGGTATGMLLKQVNAQSTLDGYDYCYIIDVIMDAVDRVDLDMWFEEGRLSVLEKDKGKGLAELGTDDAKKALAVIAGFEPAAQEGEITG